MTRAPAALRPADLTADVLVVGGGPAGSSLAHALARAGVDVLIVDRARFPRPKPCAEYLSPQASRVLAAMGALEDVERSGAAQLAGMVIRAPSGARIVGEFAGCAFKGFRDRGLSVRRETLDTILLDRARAAGARVVEGTHVIEVTRDKKVVWQFEDHTHFKTINQIFLLDVAGEAVR